jgi:FeS assembly SUF system protein
MNSPIQDATDSTQIAQPPDEQLREELIAALRTVYDPEIPVNIYDLGLIYALDIAPQGRVNIDMTLTAPACPVAETFPATVETRLLEVPGVNEVHVTLVWEPAWSTERMPDEVKLQLGLL